MSLKYLVVPYYLLLKMTTTSGHIVHEEHPNEYSKFDEVVKVLYKLIMGNQSKNKKSLFWT